MVLTTFILILLIFVAPITIIFNGPVTQGLVTLLAAVAIASAAIQIRPGEAAFWSTIINRLATVAAIPAVWMLVQVMPLQSVALDHPIWKSASAALGQQLSGSVSIDPGATLLTLTRYLSAAAITFAAAAVAIDRSRAKWVLLALTVTTTLISLLALAADFNMFTLPWHGRSLRAVATESAALGIILALAAAFQALEWRKTRRPEQSDITTFVACLFNLVICGVVVFLGAKSQIYFATICGAATLVIIMIIRRFELGPWGIAAIVAVTLLIAVAVVSLQSNNRAIDLTLVFANPASQPLIEVTQRILMETRWTGTGAGTFAFILPIYLDVNDVGDALAPTAAAGMAVEVGRPFLWVALVAAIALIVMLMRGALRRQRDSFYSAAGAGCGVTIVLLAFCNSAVFSMPILIIAATIIGMAAAQTKSRVI
jgi:hypothetical protein